MSSTTAEPPHPDGTPSGSTGRATKNRAVKDHSIKGGQMTAPVVGARRRRLLAVLVALLVIGTAAWVVTRSPFLDVDHLVVTGNASATTDEVVAASGLAPGDHMVWIDPGAAVDGIEALPWVLHAEVQREWPDTVKITVAERVPVAWVDAGEGAALVVDRSGRVLSADPQQPAGLPQLADVPAAVPVGGTIEVPEGARIAGAIAPDALANIRTIAVAPHHATLVVASGQEVRLGRPTQIADKVRAAFAVLAREEAAGKTYVDVSAPSTPVAG